MENCSIDCNDGRSMHLPMAMLFSILESFYGDNHILAGCNHIHYGPRNMPPRKMIERHLSIPDSIVERKTIYKVAYHHWPEQLIMKNKNEKRSISKLYL
jgi:hypothetical protein